MYRHLVAAIFLAAICSVSSVINSPPLTKVFGAHKERKDYKLCKIFKCLYVEMGCADTPLRRDDAMWRGNLYESLKMADTKTCPWRPCEGFDQPEHQFCQLQETACPVSDVPYGMCGQGMRCCSTQLTPMASPLLEAITSPTTKEGLNQALVSVISSLSPEMRSAQEVSTPSVPVHTTRPPQLDTPTTTSDPLKCYDSEHPNRRCILGAFCSFDPADKLMPFHYCPDPEEICCENML
ncbi:unnamed protein product [Lymnaea stagnalis]|uniref:Uncharacterized protein n=1 Tax=Lymnaea stagnalis TaxID=6523 RepID=A0AAV2HVI8_LYMST